MKVLLTPTADEERSQLTRRARERGTESHAYLLGTDTPDGVRIEHVLRIGNPHEGVAMTSPDYGALAAGLAPYLGAGLRVVGEWHRHDGLDGPSAGDAATLARIAPQYPDYLCLITTTRRDDVVTSAHTFANGTLQEHDVIVDEYPVLRPAMTATKSILQVGAGSGGSAAFPQVLKLGCERITIIDPDRLEERNLERHLADRTAVGENKAAYLARFANGRTSSEIRTLALTITPANGAQITREVQAHDVVFNATGHPAVNLLLSTIARRCGKTVLHAGVFARGRGGFVFVDTPSGACIADAQGLDLRPDDPETMRTLREQYGFTEHELAAQIGVWNDVNFVAALHVKVLAEFFKGTLTHNLFLLDNAQLRVTQHVVARRETCICNGDES